jgi:ferric-dicitrate binding protein FerR (iron transport regulator)
MEKERLWILLARKLAGEATPDELREFQQLVQEHPDWQQALQGIDDLWKLPVCGDEMHDYDSYLLHLQRMKELEVPFDKSVQSILLKKHSSRKKWYWAAATVAIIFAGIFILKLRHGAFREEATSSVPVNEISTRPGSKSRFELPDGTIVWLNAGTVLTYNKDFGRSHREVFLTGEAFFDVKKIKDKSFIVHTANIDIKVLGTVFNVKAYPEDKHTETSLIRGRLEVVIKKRPSDKIILSPSEKLLVENDEIRTAANTSSQRKDDVTTGPLVAVNKLVYSQTDSAVAETEWIHNRLVFRNESFADLAIRMERWYGVSIEITDEKLAQTRLNGIFKDETITQALDELREFISFRYETKGNKIIINP